jgi:cell wall-associated NlpC family hydrolase
MVSAHAGGLNSLLGATTTSVGLGSMGALTNAAGVAAPTAAGIVRAKTGDDAKIDTVVRFAMAQQGKPYVFGTRGPETYDCSGLMTAAYKQVGIDMPAYTFTQATLGREVDPATEGLKPGDMIFVRGGRPAADLGHVGMAISATEWIQAPRTGDVVKVGPLPYDRIQVVRRMVG